MSTALVKTRLKAAREAIGVKDWPKAERNASDALTFESTNYNARVFLAVAKLNLGQLDESEEAYRAATEAQPKTPLAWQGLASFYEKTERWPQFIDTQLHLANLAVDSNDVTKCAEALQKVLHARKEHGSRTEVLETLKLFLPESPYYHLLNQLPPPDQTNPTGSSTFEAESLIHNSLPILEELLHDKEQEEQTAIHREIERRRQRLSTTTSAEDTRKAVMQEIMSKSELPALYQQIMNHHQAPDELRRELEQKLLQYSYDLLLAVPTPFADALQSAQSEVVQDQARKKRESAQQQKDQIRGKVVSMANDVATLKIPLELAWMISIEWRDMQSEDDWDDYTLKRFIELFPDAGLSRLLQIVRKLPGPLELDESDTKKDRPPLASFSADVDTALEDAQATSIRAHILASNFYLLLKDYELVADIAQAGISLAKTTEGQIGFRLPGLIAVLETNLAVALTHLNPPLLHTRALRLLDTLLRRSPDDLRCLLARAYIYEHAERWQDACDDFQRVHSDTIDDALKFETRAEKAWCIGNVPGHAEGALEELHQVAILMDQNPEIEHVAKAKSWWRYGQCLRLIRDEEHQTAAFEAFNASILRDNTYAPAFTSLGFCYLEDVTPADEESATRCFQRAFELDEKEEVAARMLAESYSETEDWDLVEAIARRLVRNLNAKQGRYGSVETPAAGSFAAKKYGWAWKAIGMADLKGKRFEKAIPSLQHAVRGMQGDASCWLQLAIAYRGAGKHVAALKTLLRVTELEPCSWQAKYLIADIQRQIGLFDEALSAFLALQKELPEELVVAAAIAETRLSLALAEAKNGYTARCVSSLHACILSSMNLLDKGQSAARIAWKVVGDALVKLSALLREDDKAIRAVVKELTARLAAEDIDKSNPSVTVITTRYMSDIVEDRPLSGVCGALAVLSYSMRMLLYAQADDAAGSAWFDIGQALHQLENHYRELGLQRKTEDVRIESVHCVRTALQKEPLNGTFWNLLGVLSAKMSPKLAQHALIRACELNVRSAVPWTNLGLFYLGHEDYELSNKAFLRAQVLDPDYPQAWLGQAALARLHGEEEQARILTDHAATLSNGAVPEAELASAWSAFCVSGHSTDSQAIVKARFATNRYISQRAGSTSAASAAHHLHGLLSERLGFYEEAVSSFKEAVKLVEAEYEESESTEIEGKFVLANLSLARGTIANEEYDLALNVLEAAEGLLSAENAAGTANFAVLRTQCILLKALVHFWLGSAQECLEAFEEARISLADVPSDEGGDQRKKRLSTQATLLLSRILFSLGDSEQVEEAERQLLDHIYDSETEAPNVPVITTLSAMAIVKADDELLEAALAEINKLPMDEQLKQDESAEISYLLASQKRLSGDPDGQLRIYAHALHADPTSVKAKMDYATASTNNEIGSDIEKSMEHRIHLQPWLASA